MLVRLLPLVSALILVAGCSTPGDSGMSTELQVGEPQPALTVEVLEMCPDSDSALDTALDELKRMVPGIEITEAVARPMTRREFETIAIPLDDAPWESDEPVWVVAFRTTYPLNTSEFFGYSESQGLPAVTPSRTPMSFTNNQGLTTVYFVVNRSCRSVENGLISPETCFQFEDIAAAPTETAYPPGSPPRPKGGTP